MITPATTPSADPATRGRLMPATAGTGTGAGSGIERRRSTRQPVITPGVLRAVTGLEQDPTAPPDPGQKVMVTDVSLHGVGFRCDQVLPTDRAYVIEIGVGPLHLTSRLRIVRVRRRPDGAFDMGAEFC